MKPTSHEVIEKSDLIGDCVTHLLVSDECGVLVNITLDLATWRYATVTARADLVTHVLKALSWPPKDTPQTLKWEEFPYRRAE